ALVFGNERTGVTPDALAAADEAFWIPMRGFTRSLNVSAAVSATLSRAIGWRLDHGKTGGDLPEPEARTLRDRFYALSVKQRKRLFGR
ncbi:MAG TPA: TrmH family RNA methyltransferase, partial [Myxococcaceae bacterium]|nr:TrmH family RNA methyltransferase [Myxococcaceae bacterium]